MSYLIILVIKRKLKSSSIQSKGFYSAISCGSPWQEQSLDNFLPQEEVYQIARRSSTTTKEAGLGSCMSPESF